MLQNLFKICPNLGNVGNVIFKSHTPLNVGNVGNVTKSFQIMPQEMLVMLKNLGKL